MTIRQQLESPQIFTETERSVADYIRDFPQNISDMSIQALAQITYTSTPTVLRVCKKLGYDGFKSFKKALLLEIENEKNMKAQIDASRPFRKYETPSRIVGALSSLYADSVQATTAMLQLASLNKIAKDIFAAKRFFLYAVGDTGITCQLFANKLLKVNIYPILATRHNQELQETYNVRPDDYALFVTYKGMNKTLTSCAAALKRRRIRTGLITSNGESPLFRLCTETILLPNAESSSNIGTFYSQVSIGFVLNALYAVIYEIDYERHAQHKDALDAARDLTSK